MKTMRRVFVDPAAPQSDAIHEAAKWILGGGVVALATDTLYGLAIDPFNRAAVTRLFEVKGREADRAVPLIAADVPQIEEWIAGLTPVARRIAARYWPGPVTLLLPAPASLPPGVTGGRPTVGVRVPAHDVARSICAACRRPITATSANVSGEPATADPDVVEQTLGARIDLLIDTGPSAGGPPSTVVDAAGPPSLVRAGAVKWDEIQAWLNTEPGAHG